VSKIKGPVFFNKKLIEEEIKFYIDLTLAVNKVSGKTKFQDEIKKNIIDKLSAQAAEGIHERLGLKELTSADWRVTSSGRRVKRIVDEDSIILDCNVDEFIDNGDGNIRGPIPIDTSNRVVSCGYPRDIINSMTDNQIKELKEVVDKSKSFKDLIDEKKAEPKKKVAKKAKKRAVKKPAKKSKKAKEIKKAVKEVVKKKPKKKFAKKKKKG